LTRLRLAAACLLISGCAGTASVRYTRGVIPVRTAPSLNAPVLRRSLENERVEYNLIQGGWYRLKGRVGSYEQWAYIGLLFTPEEELARRCRDSNLRIDAWKWKLKGGDIVATGKVTNISTKTFKNVTAKVEYRDATGAVLASDRQLVDGETIPPGQTVGFKIFSSLKPGIAKAELSFTNLAAVEIPSCRTPQ
jgi:hypothetical protein